MTRQVALFLWILLTIWLLVRDQKLRPMTSKALWIPLLWIVISGSRPVSLWLGGTDDAMGPSNNLEGSPLDRNVFLVLIGAGVCVLTKRRVSWHNVAASNRAFLALLLYFGISVIWSPYPGVSFKRWIKEAGNVVMVLVILTETDPFQASKAVFARFTYFVIPLSFVLIQYFPELGRYYSRWTHQPFYCGVATFKNELGCSVAVCGLFLAQDIIELRGDRTRRIDKAEWLVRGALILLLVWVLRKANSSTALGCLILGAGILFASQISGVRRKMPQFGAWSFVAALAIGLLYFSGMFELVVQVLGRDMTLTGRTDIWADVLTEPINPFLGAGYQSFWMGPVVERLHLTQAHNGYLETYLNGGFIGLCLLLGFILSAARALKADMLRGDMFASMRFTVFAVMLIYNWTEAMFGGLNILWIVFLIATLKYPRLS